MKLIAAWIQVIVVLLIVGYGTWQLFEGKLAQSFASITSFLTMFLSSLASKENNFRGPEDHEND